MPRLGLVILIVSACFHYVIPANPYNTRYTRPTLGLDTMKYDVRTLKLKVTNLERETRELRAMNQNLRNMVLQMNRTLSAMISESSYDQEEKTAELTERVDNLEETVETIIDQEGIDVTDTELDRFLGNTEAQLVDIQLDPDFDPADVPTIPPVEIDEITVDQADLLGGALYSMNKQNARLSDKVAALEREVETVGEGGNAVPSRGREADRLESRLNQLERLVVSQSASSSKRKPSVGGSRISGVQGASSSNQAPNVQSDPLSDEEQEALQGIIQNTGIGRVSMFSVARTRAMFGTARVPKPVPYEVELTTKGGIFHGQNGTFICTIPGYYFITFTARTFDHRYLGVNLMKNAESLTAIFSDKHGRNVMQTQSIIVHLAEGDNLWLRMPPSDKFGLHSDQYHLSTFTGFLLYPGDP